MLDVQYVICCVTFRTGAARDGSVEHKVEPGWFSATIAATLSVITSCGAASAGRRGDGGATCFGLKVRTTEPSLRPNFRAVCCVTATLIVGIENGVINVRWLGTWLKGCPRAPVHSRCTGGDSRPPSPPGSGLVPERALFTFCSAVVMLTHGAGGRGEVKGTAGEVCGELAPQIAQVAISDAGLFPLGVLHERAPGGAHGDRLSQRPEGCLVSAAAPASWSSEPPGWAGRGGKHAAEDEQCEREASRPRPCRSGAWCSLSRKVRSWSRRLRCP